MAVVAGLLLSACSGAPASLPSSTTQATLPGGYRLVTNGTASVGVRSLPTNFNPATPEGDTRITQMVMAEVWPQPFVTDPQFDPETSGLLVSAEVHSVSPLSVVYVINPKAVWSDGVPITAADFAYCWQEHLANSAELPDSGLVAGYRDISSVVGSKDGRTVTVDFSQPFAQWQELFANLVPAHIAEKYGWAKAFAGFSKSRVISGGPFEITSYEPGKELTLSRNPNYWGPAAHLARIRFVVEHSERAVLAGLQSGALSLAEVPASSPASGLLGAGAVGMQGAKAQQGEGRSPLAWAAETGDEVWQVCFDLADPLTANMEIRRAIEHALDRSEIVADSEDLVDPKVRVAISRLTVAGEASGSGSAGTSAVTPKAPALYRPAVALSYFKAAGYWPGEGGLLRARGTGPPLTVELLEPADDWAVDQAGLVIQAELRAVGLTVDLEQQKLSKMLAKLLPAGQYEMALAPFLVTPSLAAASPEYAGSVLPTSRSPVSALNPAAPGTVATSLPPGEVPWGTTATPGSEPGALAAYAVTRDVTGFDDASFDEDLSAALSELNTPLALADLQKAEDILWSDAVTIPLFQPGLDLIRSVRLDNVTESPSWAGFMWDAQDWAILKHVPKASAQTTSTSAG